jgi:hypothetical protein
VSAAGAVLYHAVGVEVVLRVVAMDPQRGELPGPWAGLGVLCGYLAVAVAVAAVTVRRTDATVPFGWKKRARGLRSRRVRLHLSEATVKSHLGRILTRAMNRSARATYWG